MGPFGRVQKSRERSAAMPPRHQDGVRQAKRNISLAKQALASGLAALLLASRSLY